MHSAIIELIRNSALLRHLTRREIEGLLTKGSMAVWEYKENSVVHLDGDLCEGMDVLLQGRLSVERIDDKGNLLTVAVFGEGDLIGGNLLFSKNPYYPLAVTTKTPCTIVSLNRDLVLELTSDKSFLLTYLEYISDNAALLGGTIRSAVRRTIRESILEFAAAEQKKQGSETIAIGKPKKHLAEQLGVQRTSLSRELRAMKEDGLIDYDRTTITLK